MSILFFTNYMMKINFETMKKKKWNSKLVVKFCITTQSFGLDLTRFLEFNSYEILNNESTMIFR